MNKEEILAKSRAENKSIDMYEQEVVKQGQEIANITMLCVALIFCIIRTFLGYGVNCGFFALIFSGGMATYWFKWLKLKQRRDILAAILYTVIAIALSCLHIYNLITQTTLFFY